MKEIKIQTDQRNQFIDLNSKVQQAVHESGVEDGRCLVYCPHTTGAITINEGADPAVQDDLLSALKRLVPDIEFSHQEGNSDAHLKSSIVGASETVPVRNRSLKLGEWQKIFFCEFDGPRTRKVIIQVSESK